MEGEEPQSQLFHREPVCCSVINLEQMCVHTYAIRHINISDFICIHTVKTGSPRRLQGWRERGASRWEEMEKMPMDDPIRMGAMSCCYCFN